MRKVFRSAWEGIQFAAIVYLLISIVMGLTDGAGKFASGYGMARGGIAVIVIGLGFGIPSLIYETELTMWLKVLIHMGTGCLVMAGASMLGGWLPADKGLSAVLIALAIEIALAFFFWGISFFQVFMEAKRLNEKIEERQKNEKN